MDSRRDTVDTAGRDSRGGKGNESMSNKRIRLPREGVVASEDSKSLGPDADTDVEGHGFPNPAPPSDFLRRTPSSGGDAIPTDEDTKGERPA